MESAVPVPFLKSHPLSFPPTIASLPLAANPSACADIAGERPDCSVAGLSHDIRNMLAALHLYCDLLSEPAVLTPSHRHYAADLRLVAESGSGLLKRLAHLASAPSLALSASPVPPTQDLSITHRMLDPQSRRGHGNRAVRNLVTELEGCRELLAALAGPAIRLELDCRSYAGPLPLSGEDLTRILLNLVRNAVQAMPNGGGIRIAVQPNAVVAAVKSKWIVLSVEDDGPGIAAADLTHLFESGYSSRMGGAGTSWRTAEIHGLGLAIVRGLVESAGGSVCVLSPSGKGARFEITLPVGKTNDRSHERRSHSDCRKGSHVLC